MTNHDDNDDRRQQNSHVETVTVKYPCAPPPSEHMQLAVRDCASDSSPYVRKCAANAIPKIFVLDPDQGPQLWQVSYSSEASF